MPSRLCPVCRLLKIFRREVKTCGSYQCQQVWRSLSPTDKAKLIEEADLTMTDSLIEEVRSGAMSGFRTEPTTESPPDVPLKHSAGKTVERDNEFLKKMWGEDAPGIVKDDEKEDK